ncbi:MAG TPA: methyltransferase domain-containing protein [Terracidiphilus sp.]|nr:methyltransferase domain-containing protein [Terracidiphilus sp.]
MNVVQSVVRPVVKGVVPCAVRLWIKDIRNARSVRRNAGRIALVNEILPAYARLEGRILWVGCRRYTKEYGAILSRHGGECWTTDIEIAHARWGEEGRHFTGDVVEIDRLIASETFDCVLCNGVFGFGVDTLASQLTALEAMNRILKPGGRLLLGWNTDRVEDPASFDFVQSAFVDDDPIGRGARYEIPEAGYVYSFLRRRGE